MLVTFGNAGQFGNLYLASAHRIAHALSHEYSLSLYELGGFRKYFAASIDSPFIHLGGAFPQKLAEPFNQFIRRATKKHTFRVGRFAIHLDRVGGNNISHGEIASLAKKGLLIHQGWSFRDREALKQQIEEVREILDFNEEYKNAARARFERIRGTAGNVVGVHVRRGDYAKFSDGRFFYDDSVYLRVAAEAVEACGFDASNTVILGFSNEKLEWPALCCGSRVVTEPGSWWDDFLCLSMCDLIIGPPSTYSGAASFLRDVNWFQIRDSAAPFRISDAKPMLETGIQIQ